MSPILYYGFTLLFFFAAYCVLGWGLNLQFGEAGILNFAYIAFVAVGAYITGVTSMGKPVAGSGQSYMFGARFPFPVSLLLGGAVSCLLALLVAFIAFRRLRSDYLAMVLISVSLVLYDVINNYVPLFDGADGLNTVPMPLSGVFHLNANSFLVFFAVAAVVIALIMWLVISRITRSPLGRTLRAIRDDPDVVSSLGKNVFRYQLTAMLIGAFYAGIGGGLIIEFSSSFNTSAWLPPETFLIFAALIIGGMRNNLGVVMGAFVVPVLFTQLPKFLPDIPGHPGLILNLEGAVIGTLLIVTLWFRPQGVIPERRRRFTGFLGGEDSAAPGTSSLMTKGAAQ
ncbi:MAG TPA: branched-chain amino acid ABC transporter permease [Streptosporangiaceae bacterium]|jgi:ABC-type branched-subunit amino acid transport system permease subunit|nr:branched-chain amino acid ABC transporter permease [Streptosporangiaceae bacterium]